MVPTLNIVVSAGLKVDNERTTRLVPVVRPATVNGLAMVETDLAPLKTNRDKMSLVLGQDVVNNGKRDIVPVDAGIVAPSMAPIDDSHRTIALRNVRKRYPGGQHFFARASLPVE